MKTQRVLLWCACLALVLLAGRTAAAQSGGGYELEWQVIGSAGDEFVRGGEYQIGFTLGQAEDTPVSAGGSYQIAQGYWAALLPPVVAPVVLSITRSGNDASLDWNDTPGLRYRVYRGDRPWFVPTTWIDEVDDPPYPDWGVLGDPDHNIYYFVTAVDGGWESVPSNRVGGFSFDLVPGSN